MNMPFTTEDLNISLWKKGWINGWMNGSEANLLVCTYFFCLLGSVWVTKSCDGKVTFQDISYVSSLYTPQPPEDVIKEIQEGR